MTDASTSHELHGGSLREVAALFLKLGVIAFGGPAAHIAMMRKELVERRGWLSDQRFLDLLGATNLIPGPNSTEMAIHMGLLRAGWRGLIVAGACFILPAVVIVLALSWAYVEYGSKPEAGWLLYGIKPVIIAVVVQALYGLFKTAVKNWFLGAMGAAVLALYLIGANEIALLFGAGAIVVAVENGRRIARALRSPAFLGPFALGGLPIAAAVAATLEATSASSGRPSRGPLR